MTINSSMANIRLSGGGAGGGSAREQTLGERLLERHGGIIFSIALHLMAASFLLVWPWIVPPDVSKPKEPETIRIAFSQPESQPPVPPVVVTPPPPAPNEEDWTWDEPASTGPVADPDNAVENPMSDLPETPPEDIKPQDTQPEEAMRPVEEVSEVVLPEPETGKTRRLTEEELAYIQEQKKLVSEQLDQLDKKADDQSNTVQMLLLTTAARQTFYTSAGAKEGVARTIDLRDVPKGIMQRVLKRNGIEIVYKYIEAGPGNPSPLSGVVTNDTTYVNHDRIPAGNYEVMEISAQALKNLSRLEEEWIARQGLEPLDIRIETVTYGIMRVGDTGHWDLGILEIEYHKLAK